MCKSIFAKLLNIYDDKIIINNNPLNKLIYDIISNYYISGKLGSTPWSKLDKVLCPPNDMYIDICKKFNFEIIDIPENSYDLNMDFITDILKNDINIKLMFCTPAYSNNIIKKITEIETAAVDFTIIYDNTISIYYENKLNNNILRHVGYLNENKVFYVLSTENIIMPNISILATGEKNINEIKNVFESIDITNQAIFYNYFKTSENVLNYIKDYNKKLRLKLDIMERELKSKFKNNSLLS